MRTDNTTNLEAAKERIRRVQRILSSGYLDQEAIEQIDRALYQTLDLIKQAEAVEVLA